MKKLVILIAISAITAGIVVYSSALTAQTACPYGVSSGDPRCGPSGSSGLPTTGKLSQPYEERSAPAAVEIPEMYWQTTWGAIAEDPATSKTSVYSGGSSRSAAEVHALRRCEERGGEHCKLLLVYHNQCAVIAESNARIAGEFVSVAQSAPTIEEAAKLGIEGCVDLSKGSACQIIYENCTKPVLKYR